MLEGRFGDTTGRPYVDGRLFVLGRQELNSNISFLVDTGADGSMGLSPLGVGDLLAGYAGA